MQPNIIKATYDSSFLLYSMGGVSQSTRPLYGFTFVPFAEFKGHTLEEFRVSESSRKTLFSRWTRQRGKLRSFFFGAPVNAEYFIVYKNPWVLTSNIVVCDLKDPEMGLAHEGYPIKLKQFQGMLLCGGNIERFVL